MGRDEQTMPYFKSDEWKREWARRPAWTARELARLCCGWDPASDVIPDHPHGPEQLERTLDLILLAIRVKDPELPIIEDLRWAETQDEQFYRATPLLKPAKVWKWAADRYEKTFPFRAEDFPAAVSTVHDRMPRRLATLMEIARNRDGNASQKEVAAQIQLKLGVSDRDAQAYAALIRPDEAASQDQRAARRRDAKPSDET